MELETIQQNKELMKKLSDIHKTLTAIIKDDIDHDKLYYKENEVSLGIDSKVVNEHIMYNRLKKINSLKELSENWDNFKTLYKNDNILNKVGEEFIKGKFQFDDKILKEIKDYPHRKQVLYYFNKAVNVDVPNLTTADYNNFKDQILPDIEKIAKEQMARKEALISAIKEIQADKSSESLNKQWILHDNTPLGKVDGLFGTFMGSLSRHVKNGDFKFEQSGSKITIEVPISGVIDNGDKKEKINSTIFTVDLNNIKEYSMQLGTLDKPKLSVEDRIKSIRGNLMSKTPESKFKIV